MKRSLPQNILSHICSLWILFSLVPLGIFADTTTFGSTGNGPVSIISDISGNLYISNVNDNTVSKITPDGTSTTFATTGQYPYAMVMGNDGNIYTSNIGDRTVSKITPDGTSTILGTTGPNSYGITIDGNRNIYTTSPDNSTIHKITPDGTSTTFATTGVNPYGITIDTVGNLYTANHGDNTVSKITPDGTSTILGTTGQGPYDIVIDQSGNLYTSNIGENTISKITPDGTSTTFATTGPSPYNLTIDTDGNLYTANTGNNTVSKMSPTGTSIIFWLTGNNPLGITTDINWAVYTSNFYENTVSKITPDTTPPVITLYGNEEVTLFQNQTYYDNGNNCVDNVDGYCNAVLSGSVVSSIPGTYLLEFSYTDQVGNTGKATRTVHIIADTTPPEISLYGNNPLNIYIWQSYSEPGAYCSDNADGYCGYRSQASSGSVDTNNTGTYILTYTTVDLSGNTGSTTRTVNVLRDTTAPVISVNGDADMTLIVTQAYSENGASCYDNADGYCGYISQASSGSVDTNTVWNYILEYSYTDQSGNTGKATRTVHVIGDTVWPDVVISGDNPVDIYKGHTYSEQGAYCSDNLDSYCGYLSEASSGSVDTDRIGTYTLEYTFSDQAGNTSKATRTVHVIADTIVPTIFLYGNRMITIPVWATYSEPGAYCSDNADGYCGYISQASSGSVDTENTGTYILTYSAVDLSGNIGSTTRTVNVWTDTTPPIITINGESSLHHANNVYYTDNGASAIDDDPNFDGNITATPNLSGYLPVWEYTITYTAIDPSGNLGTALRSVHVGQPIYPFAYINTVNTSDTTPMLVWSMSNDPTAMINITINGKTYTGTNNGNGTWTLPDNTISPALTQWTSYNVTLHVRNIFWWQYTQNYTSRVNIITPVELSLHLTLENTGAIHTWDTVTYRYDVKNEGTNVYNPGVNQGAQILGLVPDAFGLGNFVNQAVNIPTSNPTTSCGNYWAGGTGSVIFWQRFAQYGDTHILLCLALQQTIPAGGTYSFSITRTAISDFPEWLTNRAILVDSTFADPESIILNNVAQDPNGDFFIFQNNNIAINHYSSMRNTPVTEQTVANVGPGGGGGGNTVVQNPSNTWSMNLIEALSLSSKVSNKETTITDSHETVKKPRQKISAKEKREEKKVQEIKNPLSKNVCTKMTQVYKPSQIKTRDLPENEFREPIQKLIAYRTSENILGSEEGILANTFAFNGEKNITRAEYVKILVRAFSCQVDTTEFWKKTESYFSDVLDRDEFSPYINYAVKQWWINGYKGGKFRPDAPINTREAFKILMRAIGSSDEIQVKKKFSLENIDWIYDRHITRQEAAKIIYTTIFWEK